MSNALSKAIWSRLTGGETLTGDALTAQSNLIEILAADPDLTIIEPPLKVPAVFFGNKSDAQGADSNGNLIPLYPSVTFRPGTATPYNQFQQQTGVVEAVYYEFEIWENTRSALTISQIGEYLEQLLDLRRGVAPCLTLESGKIFHHQTHLSLQVVYDTNIHSWFGLVRYAFVEARY